MRAGSEVSASSATPRERNTEAVAGAAEGDFDKRSQRAHHPAVAEAPAAARNELLFDAVLHPHRSLNRGGFIALMAALGVVSFTAGMVFLLAGAWPVFGFFGLDVALVWLAFRLNYRSGRLVERVRLTCQALEVERIAASGRASRWRFQPYWLRVVLEDRGEHHSRLALRSHGKELVIGAFLSPPERASLCAALTAALARCRCLPAAIG